MSKLSVNLKLYIQLPSFVPVLLLHFIFLFSFLFMKFKSWETTPIHILIDFIPVYLCFCGTYLLWDTTIGIQRDILAKPFSFCLPNHYKMPSRVISIFGCGFILLHSLISLIFLQPTTLRGFVLVLFIPAILLLLYSSSFYEHFSLRKIVYDRFYHPEMLMELPRVLGGFFLMISLFILEAIMSNADTFYLIFPLSLLSLPFLVKAWKASVSPDNKRRYVFDKKARRPLILADLTKMINVEKLDLQSSESAGKTTVSESIFMSRMNQSRHLGIKRSMWGTLYEIIGDLGSINQFIAKSFQVSKHIFLLTLIMLASFSRYLTTVNFLLVFIGWLILILSSIIPGLFSHTRHNLLLPVGRQERFSVLVAILSLKLFFGFASLGAIVIALQGIFGFLIEGMYVRPLLNDFPIDWCFIFFPLVIMPVWDIARFVFNRLGNPALIIPLLLFSFIGLLPIFAASIPLNISTMILMVFIANGLLVVLLATHCFRDDLVSMPL